MAKPTLRTRLCDILGIEYPVVLAGMSEVAGHRVTAAVSEAGGLGVLGAAIMGPDEWREEIRKGRQRTDKPCGRAWSSLTIPRQTSPRVRRCKSNNASNS